MAVVGAPRHLNPVRAPTPGAGCAVRRWRRAAPRGAEATQTKEFHGWDAEERHAGVAALTVTSGL